MIPSENVEWHGVCSLSRDVNFFYPNQKQAMTDHILYTVEPSVSHHPKSHASQGGGLWEVVA